MSHPSTVLLVDDNDREVRAIADALGRRALHLPIRVRSGEQALVWSEFHPCDVCVIAHELPGMTGVQTMVRLHERQPALPVVVLSRAHKEAVVVDAWAGGAAAYIPSSAALPEQVAEAIAHWGASADPDARLLVPQAVDPADALLYTPTHENRLRVIGRQLDLGGYSAITLSETAGGCIVRALRKDDLTPIVLEFSDRDFPLLVREVIATRGSGEHEHRAHALLPTGYEDFLRAVGHDLDAQAATAVTVVDLGERIAVGGLVPVGVDDVIRQEPFSGVLRQEKVAAFLDAAFARRSRVARGPWEQKVRRAKA